MEKRKITTSFLKDYEFITLNKLSNIANNYNTDITTKATSLDKMVNDAINNIFDFKKIESSTVENDNKIKFEEALKALDHWMDFYNALFFKYTLNITTSKNGFKYYQLKGAIAVIDGKKIWVNYSLGTEKKVEDNFKTINAESLIRLNSNLMFWKAYEKLREIHTKKK